MIRKNKIVIIIAIVTVLVIFITIGGVGCKTTATETTIAETVSAGETTAAETAAVTVAKPYEGITVKILCHESPVTMTALEWVKPRILEAEGIILDWAHIEAAEYMSTKLAMSLENEKGDWDIVSWWPDAMGLFYGKNNLEDLTPYLENDNLTYDWFNFADYNQDVVKNSMTWEDQGIIGLPFIPNVFVLFYRKDLFEKAGIMHPPTTWAEYIEDAKKLNDPDNNTYGNLIMGKFTQGFYVFHTMWASLEDIDYNPWFIDEETFEPTLDRQDARKAAELMFEAMKYAPPDSYDYDWVKGQEAMCAGKGAMFLQWSSSFGMYQDPESSTVVDKVAAAVLPGRSTSPTGNWSFSILSDSKNKEAAYKVWQWLLSKDMAYQTSMGEVASKGGTWYMARKSVMAGEEALKEHPELEVMYNQMGNVYNLPASIDGGTWNAALTLMDENINAMCAGQISVDEFLETTQEGVREILVKNGYLK